MFILTSPKMVVVGGSRAGFSLTTSAKSSFGGQLIFLVCGFFSGNPFTRPPIIKPPEYSKAIEDRHVEYQVLVRLKQTKLLTALQAKLSKLQVAAAAGDDVELKQANLKNEIADLEFKTKQKYRINCLPRKRQSNTTKTRPTVKQRWISIVGRCMN